ncbi:methyltransferase domain-containing protein [Bacteriovorax stolpii]|uniref:methyltransferase domain-containing protein n=1 Tax=Bacteriovorax stolpii TaxID=960 RepID=UPI00105DC9CF|nr:methyltransferase domain-containing protein [Bacteriovorax stolpii]
MTKATSVKATLTRDNFLLPSNMDSRKHSQELDRLLGFNTLKIESKLKKHFQHYALENSDASKRPYKINRESWIGLDPHHLLTPYGEVASLFEKIEHKKIKTVTDLGCAYGRVGIVSAFYFPDVSFIGYELVSKRIKEAQRVYETLKLKNYRLIEDDILLEDFNLPESCIYFIYDFGRVSDLKKILNKLIERMQTNELIIIARGDEIQSLMTKFYKEFKKENTVREKSFLIYTHQLNE